MSSGSEPPAHQLLNHYDRSQLLFQIQETMVERTYLRHGIDVREGDVVFDVGANVGVAAVFFAAECRAGLVHSFEPVLPIYDLLCENTERYPACVPHNYGLSDASRRDIITYYAGAAAMSGMYADPLEDAALVRRCILNSGRSEADADRAVDGRYDAVELDCELMTLSDAVRILAVDQIDLLKIDVEKAELDVLNGIEEPHWAGIKQIVAEVHDQNERLDAVVSTLERQQFLVAVEQDPVMRGTGVHMIFARRSTSR